MFLSATGLLRRRCFGPRTRFFLFFLFLTYLLFFYFYHRKLGGDQEGPRIAGRSRRGVDRDPDQRHSPHVSIFDNDYDNIISIVIIIIIIHSLRYQSSLIDIPGLTLDLGLHKLVFKMEIETGVPGSYPLIVFIRDI